MLRRERRRELTTNVYQAQLIAAGLRIDQSLFNAWTMIYEDEVSQDNYRPAVQHQKKRMLEQLQTRHRAQTNLVKRAEQYTVTSSKQLMPYTKAELSKIQSRLRRRAIARASDPEDAT